MIYLDNAEADGLGRPSFKKFLKVATKVVAPHTMLLKKKQNDKFLRVATKVVAPHTMLLKKRKNDKFLRVATKVVAPHTMLLNRRKNDRLGLGKAKMLKKIKLKPMLKQVGKISKVVAPMVAGMIPVGGGVASGIVGKVVNSGAGKTALKLGKSKVGSAVLSQAGVSISDKPTATAVPVKKKKGFLAKKSKAVATKTTAVATKATVPVIKKTKSKFPILKKKKTAKVLAVGSQGAEVKELQEQLGVKADGIFGAKTQQALEQATGQKSINTDAVSATASDAEPVGEITPVKSFEPAETTAEYANNATPKNNALLYVGGAAALAGVVYLATKKK